MEVDDASILSGQSERHRALIRTYRFRFRLLQKCKMSVPSSFPPPDEFHLLAQPYQIEVYGLNRFRKPCGIL